MALRTIKIRSFSWEEDGNWRAAGIGQTVDLSPEAIERGERFDAFEKVTGKAGAAAITSADDGDDDGDEVDLAELSHDELVAFLKKERPTINELLEAADGDPDLAQRILDAESEALGRDPRKGLVEGLTAVIGRTAS